MRYLFKIALFMIISVDLAFSQSQIALYQMQKSVPQSSYVNPSFAPKSKFIIGLPVINSTYISLEAPFSVNDVLARGNGDSLRIDTDAILNSLKNNNRINIDGNTSLLFLGYNNGRSFFTLSFNTRFNSAFAYPGSVLELIIQGPAENQDGSRSIELDELNLRAQLFNELAFSYNRKITDKLTVGGKLKYLQGIVNVNLNDMNGKIISNIDSINISTNPWSFQTAGIDYVSDNPDKNYFLFKNKNVGWAIDIGAHYQLKDNINLSASILDLGSITWKENTKTYKFNAVNYTFDGFDFIDIVKDDGGIDESILDQELDSLKNIFDPEEVEGEAYTTPLTGRFYLGGTYTLMDMHTFGAVFYGDVYKARLSPAFALTYNLGIGNILDLGVSASYRNKTFGNFGIGLSIKGGPVQAYVLGENFESLIYPSRARIVGVRAGLILALGKNTGF